MIYINYTSIFKNWFSSKRFSSVQFNSVAQSCPTLCDPMNRSTPGLPIHHQLPEFTQTHVHRVGDAIQPSLPLSSPSPPAPNPSQYRGLFQWVYSSHDMAKVLEFQLQHQHFQWTPRTYPPEKRPSPHKRMVLRVFVMDIIYKNLLYVYLKNLYIKDKNIMHVCVCQCVCISICVDMHIYNLNF